MNFVELLLTFKVHRLLRFHGALIAKSHDRSDSQWLFRGLLWKCARVILPPLVTKNSRELSNPIDGLNYLFDCMRMDRSSSFQNGLPTLLLPAQTKRKFAPDLPPAKKRRRHDFTISRLNVLVADDYRVGIFGVALANGQIKKNAITIKRKKDGHGWWTLTNWPPSAAQPSLTHIKHTHDFFFFCCSRCIYFD